MKVSKEGYKQLRPLDKVQKDERVLCLKYVRLAFSPSNDDLIHSKYDSVRKNWDASKTKHRDRSFPQGVAVLLYWDYVTTIEGIRENYGHIAVILDGKIYSNLGKYS